MALPKEPRQKMINLMYLVLTALLALNVSSEILNAFKTIDTSLNNANNTINDKNHQIFNSFEEMLSDPKTKDSAAVWFPRADQARKMSDSMITYISALKDEILKQSDLKPDGTYKEDDLEAATRIMSDPGTKGEELRKKLTAYRDNLLAINPLIDSVFQHGKGLPIDLSTPKSYNKSSTNSWASAYFNMVPTVASLTILDKFENDIKNSESMVVDFCHRQVGAVKLVYDQFEALAGTNATYLMPGQELDITAGVGAFSKAANPTVTVDGQNQPLNDSGYALFKSTVGAPGSYTKNVKITFTKPDGTIASVDKVIQYTVGSPTGANVSADDVKVLYIDLDNHLSVSGGTVGDEKVTASIDNGTLTKTAPGKYIAHPAKAGSANVTLNVAGKPETFTFRVKDVPDPIAMVGASKGGRMKANDFKAQVGVRADLENFVFEGVRFTVTSYTFVCNGAGFPDLQFRDVTGNTFNDVSDLIDRCKPGTTVTIDNIRAAGPGGTRTLPPIVFNLY